MILCISLQRHRQAVPAPGPHHLWGPPAPPPLPLCGPQQAAPPLPRSARHLCSVWRGVSAAQPDRHGGRPAPPAGPGSATCS